MRTQNGYDKMEVNHTRRDPCEEISKRQIIDDLKQLGVEEGDHLAVALSLRSIGHVVGGPKTFIEALLEVVGPNGTIMMPISSREKKALETLKTEVAKGHELVKFILYGSKAKGTDVEDSDLDVIIVLKELTPLIESSIDDLVFDINLKYDCLITPLYFSQEGLETGPLSESPVYKKAQQEGITL